jgi:15-cis-phytoene synthase
MADASGSLSASYDWCRRLAKDRAKNFYYSFSLLSKAQHDAMCAVYAFMRVCDDLSDGPGMTLEERRAALAAWRRDLALALDSASECPAHPCWPALRDTVERFRIPRNYFDEMIEGVGSDLEFRPVQTFDELYRYCYLVASIVGLVIVHIFGFTSPRALALAAKCGVAFQLTNIIRDVKEDAENGRVYLPAEDLSRFAVPAGRLAGPADESVRALLRYEADRARRYYEEAAPLVGMVDQGSRKSLAALIEIYRTLLDRIAAADFDVFSRRIALSKWEKSWIIVKRRLGSAPVSA